MIGSTPVRWTESELVEDLGLDAIELNGQFASPTLKRVTQPAAARAANDDAKIPQGGRNNMLTSLAGAMRRKGASANAIDVALQAENRARCEPPLDPLEVSTIATGIMRYAPSTAEGIRPSLTDTGNAARLGRRHEKTLRYVFGQGWLHWNGLCWEKDQSGTIMELAKQVARDIYAEGEQVEDSMRDAVAKHAKSSLQAARLKAMVELAQSLPALAVQPESLDTHDMLLGVANGVVDLQTGKLREPDSDALMTRHCPVAFNAVETCPQFEQFIDQTTGGNKALARYLQRVVGYTLTGRTEEQCLFFLYGSGANGKSTFLNVIKEVLGVALSRQTPSETLMTRHSSSTNDIARLQNARMVIANEIEDGSLLAESLVKQMTGGEALTARFHYAEFFEFTPKFKLFIAGNHKPVIRGRDNGMWRRVRLIPFEVTFAPQQQDKHLQGKLRAELPGILNWALKGCKDWLNSGLAEPKAVVDAVNSYREEMDIIGAWVNDRCTTGVKLECKAGEAFRSYKFWAEENGYKPMAAGTFGREFSDRFVKVKRNDSNYYLGIKTGKFDCQGGGGWRPIS